MPTKPYNRDTRQPYFETTNPMSRDFANRDAVRRANPKNKTKTIPAWLWFILGAILGAFGMALVFLWSSAHPAKTVDTSANKPTANENKIPKPRFDFYKLLQDSEVIVPATESGTDTGRSGTAQIPVEYILQVGSFPNKPEAEKLRDELKDLHLDTHIETVEIHKGEIWHRVIVGPFDSQEKLASARSALVANQYTALVLKRAKNSK